MTLNDTMQHYTTVYKTIQHYIRLYGTIRHCTTLYKAIQQYIRLYDTVRHYTTLYKTIRHYTTLYVISMFSFVVELIYSYILYPVRVSRRLISSLQSFSRFSS